MLGKGIRNKIIPEYTNLSKEIIDENLKSVAELPYFEGDFLPITLEEAIKEMNREEERQKQQEEEAVAEATVEQEEEEKTSNVHKKKQRKKKKA